MFLISKMKKKRSLLVVMMLAISMIIMTGCTNKKAYSLEKGEIFLSPTLTLGMSMEGLPEEWVQVRNLPIRTEYAGFPMEVTLEADEAGKLRSVKAISQDELTTDQQDELRKTLSQDYGLPLTAVQNREEQPRSWLMDEGGYRVDMSLLASSYGDGEVVIEVYAQPTAKETEARIPVRASVFAEVKISFPDRAARGRSSPRWQKARRPEAQGRLRRGCRGSGAGSVCRRWRRSRLCGTSWRQWRPGRW